MASNWKREHFHIGILGGMGPEAGVLLQQLIIKATPVVKDQDHIAVITYTNPHVPDRTESLARDGGDSYVGVVIESLHVLEQAGVDVLVMACNTAHARVADIRRNIGTPLVDIVELARAKIASASGIVGILATDGTIGTGLFTKDLGPDKVILPDNDTQREVMEIIRDIKKAGQTPAGLERLTMVVCRLQQEGCAAFLLGCTELSICHDALRERLGNVFIDPMRLAASRLVELTR